MGQQEEAAAKKMKEFKTMSVEDIKKKLTKRGLEVSGNKEGMLKTLFLASMQDDALAKRKADLGSKSQQELKELLLRNGLETGPKEKMIKTVLAHEEKCRADLKAFEDQVHEVV